MRFGILAFIGVLLSSSLAIGQEPQGGSPAPESLTIDALVAEVLEKNPELNFYKAEIDAAKGIRRAAGTWANPELGGALGRKKIESDEDNLTRTGSAGELSLMQTFEWPGRLGLRKAIADCDIKLAELGLEQFRTFLAAQTRIKAYEMYAAQEIAAATREVADHFRSLGEVLAQREPAGLTPLLETRIIEAMELNMQRKASEASLASRRALLDLNQLRGAAPDAELRLAPVRLAFQPLEDTGAFMELARANDFLARIRAVESEKRSLEVDLAKNERLPAVSAGPFFSQERAGEKESVLGAAISLPLPLWGQNQGNIEAAQARQTQAKTVLSAAQRDAERRVAETAEVYAIKVQEMSHWRPDSLQHFKEAAELADRHYRLGAVPVSTYVELQSQYLEAMAGLHDTRKEALEAAAQLELLTGKALSLVREEAP